MGVDPLLTRMQNAKTTCDELKAFYKARAELEEEYSKKLFAISRKALGSVELGTLRASLDVARGETEAMGKQHAMIAQQMKAECEEPLAAFAGGIKERRKIVQHVVEKLLKTKQQQTAQVNKCRDRYEQDCLRIKGYLAQGHMVMGQEERKNKAKLEKTQISMASDSQEYEAAVKVLEETTGRWNKEWKAACDKFQDLEEERLDFTKSSLWAFANIASTVCVSDDGSCEKIRLALENCEVEKDIANFIKLCGTGQEIPDPPKYINFAKGDGDSASEVSDDDNNYAVAQFPRTTNPAFRTASPSHEFKTSQSSKHSTERDMSEDPEEPLDDPIPAVVQAPARATGQSVSQPPFTQDTNSGRPQPLTYRPAEPHVPPNYSPSQHGPIDHVPHNEYPTEGMTMYCRREDQPSRLAQSDLSASTRPPSRDSVSDYSNPSSFTSADPMSGKSSPVKQPAGSVQMPGMSASPDKSLTKRRSGFFAKSPFNANSPFRRKSKKEQSNPLTASQASWSMNASRSDLSSAPSTQSSPTKQTPHSRQPPAQPFNRHAGISAPEGEEAADPRAHFQLNIGPNVLDVASPDQVSSSHQSTPRASVANSRRQYIPPVTGASDDPVAQALANLKQSSGSGGFDMSKRASLRQPVDAYHRVRTPAPEQKPTARPAFVSAQTTDVFAAQRGTPPPAYESNVRAQSALGVPQPAFTSKDMRSRTDNWGMGSSVSAPVGRPPSSMGRPASRDGRRSPGPTATVPRAASPQPSNAVVRSRSPAPHNGNMPMRARSPAPVHAAPNMRSRSPAPPGPDPTMRARSPAPDMRMRGGPASAPRPQQPQQQTHPQGGSGRNRTAMMNGRPTSSYAGQPQYEPAAPSSFDIRGRGHDPAVRRERSKSIAAPGALQPGSRQGSASQYRAASPNPYGGNSAQRSRSGTTGQAPYNGGHNMSNVQLSSGPGEIAMYEPPGTADVSPSVCFMARALYSYSAAIPEELSFSKGDILAVLRLQDDGWWEAEVNRSLKTGGPGQGGVGLVPSNYLQRC